YHTNIPDWDRLKIYGEYAEKTRPLKSCDILEYQQIAPRLRYVDDITTAAQLQISPKPTAKSR
ncbi:MAG: hypothetical protein P8X85_22645, partial [Desulfobacterales bacterium]